MVSQLKFTHLARSRNRQSFREVVEEGLSAKQKNLPSRFFYDTEGSEIFEKITELRDYYLTRTEQLILLNSAKDMIAASGENVALVEFGSGSSYKTRLLIEAAIEQQGQVRYTPIDISKDFLKTSSLELVDAYPELRIDALGGEYHDAVQSLPEHEGPRLILFLGSNIGNFPADEAQEFLGQVQEAMEPEDRLLLGTDLVKKHKIIEAAYNDPEGVTEAFNKNILKRINKELDGHFDLDKFKHHAPFLPEESRVEMRLISGEDQTVAVDALDQTYEFKKGEYIHTEYSHKYTLESVEKLSEEAGLEVQEVWQDPDLWFALTLLKPGV